MLGQDLNPYLLCFIALQSSLKDDAKALKDESDRLESSNKELQERMTIAQQRTSQAQNETTSLMREKKELLGQLSRLQVRLDASNSASSDSKESEDEKRRLAEQLDIATEENAKRVGETAQFQQMKKLMQTQAGKIRDLRKRLQRYEPDDDDCKGEA